MDGVAGLLLMIIAFSLAIVGIEEYVSYLKFETKYEIQESYYSDSDINENFIIIVKINDELAEYQASKQQFGEWSCLPDRVLDLTPIGIGD